MNALHWKTVIKSFLRVLICRLPSIGTRPFSRYTRPRFRGHRALSAADRFESDIGGESNYSAIDVDRRAPDNGRFLLAHRDPRRAGVFFFHSALHFVPNPIIRSFFGQIVRAQWAFAPLRWGVATLRNCTLDVGDKFCQLMHVLNRDLINLGSIHSSPSISTDSVSCWSFAESNRPKAHKT